MEQKQIEASSSYDPYALDFMAIAKTALIGGVAGVIGWLLYLGVAQYFVEPVFCRSAETFAVCRNGGTLAWIVSTVIVLAASVAAMAKLGVYRPLLVALAVFATLWGLSSWLGSMAWYTGLLWHTLLFTVAFMTYGWLARVSNFVIALVVTLAVVVLARLILLAA